MNETPEELDSEADRVDSSPELADDEVPVKSDKKVKIDPADGLVDRSFFIFHKRCCFRWVLIKIVFSKWFDRLIIGAILLNSLLLGI